VVISIVAAVSFYSIPIVGLKGGAIAILLAYSVKFLLTYGFIFSKLKGA